jgi:prephenate dehydrogenase
MWRDIALANRPALLNELDSYIAQVTHLRELLAKQEGAGLEAIFARARDARQSWIAAIEAAEQQRPHEQGGD